MSPAPPVQVRQAGVGPGLHQAGRAGRVPGLRRGREGGAGGGVRGGGRGVPAVRGRGGGGGGAAAPRPHLPPAPLPVRGLRGGADQQRQGGAGQAGARRQQGDLGTPDSGQYQETITTFVAAE